MAILADSYPSSNADSSDAIRAGLTTNRGQAFNIHTPGYLDSVQFYLRRDGSPTGNIEARLYAAIGTLGTDAVPTGEPLATSIAIDASTVPTSNSLVTFVFDGTYLMEADTTYVVVVSYSGGDDSNFVRFNRDGSSPAHEGNVVWGTSNWYSNNTSDAIFYVYIEPAETSSVLTAVQDGADIVLNWG